MVSPVRRKNARKKPVAKPAIKLVKRSVTLDPKLDAEAHRLVGDRGFSALVNDALERELQGRRLQHWLDERERELGPIPEEDIDAVEELWRKAGL